MKIRTAALALTIMLVIVLSGSIDAHAQAMSNISILKVIDNETVFPNNVSQLWLAYGDVTNDENPDLVVTKGTESNRAGAAVFQFDGTNWDNGTLLQGPTLNNAFNPVVAPIRNDGLNWLVYSEHRSGNTGEWLRAHRYSDTSLIENKDITSRYGWPGWFAPGVGDIDQDGNIEIWTITYQGNPSLRLRRHEWDPNAQSYPGFQVKDGGENYWIFQNPIAADFLGNGSESLIWVSQSKTIDLVQYTPNSGTNDYTSNSIVTTAESIKAYDAGNIDGNPGTDIVFSTWNGTRAKLYLVSGETFDVSELSSNITEPINVVQVGDLDGNGIDEIYIAGINGGIFGFDQNSGFILLDQYPDVVWQSSESGNFISSEREEVYFGGKLGGRRFQVIQLSISNSPPIADMGDAYSSSEGTSITFDASASFDPDGDDLQFRWDFDHDGTWDTDWSVISTANYTWSDDWSGTCKVEVSDGQSVSSDTADVEIMNSPPVVNSGADQTVYRNDLITVSGTWTDPAEALDNSYAWAWDLDGSIINGTSGYGDVIVQTISFSEEGLYNLTFLVEDKDGGVGSDNLVIEVLNQPPDCSNADPTIDSIWPPNHIFVPIEILNITDPEGDDYLITINSIFQDESVDDTGDGAFAPDGQGIGTSTVEVRAERDGSDNGRVYHIYFSVDDGHAGTCSGEILVGVPKKSNSTAVDDGALHDSTIVPQ